ncbi:MAG: ATP synthase F1 subunit gamma [Armatimonadetes bacterium]|nr:ATP synthase F1 subunit gamma [Armatimonadota bacterium]PIU65522.1 MAG: ATP synthase F1 subunit gamma [Armatimonadetes bacterium CG07_land_8_20_14_0_80_59_28]PIX40136.1 MAG: ATP synthase F1 subunit gamma [Armatimonadetes bacterium CG_4_8_14_3_um_filter_58_9]PIY44288.1 MAG: ATP synthase F1 subunit gamma [Armatimonadetes bacterium CG_4_10_14_3_um_filter_59_10]PJB78870.1 MAG: ATP synthase F1 subunit gamma [Armatimonadetes bacterium CG_4_9_14_3_um_filter_58_7]
MASLRDIRRKIRAVKNIQQITQAMKMIAAQRLKRAQGRVNAAKPYSEKMQQLVGYLAPHARDINHPLLELRDPVDAVGVVVVSGEKGLCGSYNNNVIRAGVNAIANIRERRASAGDQMPVHVISVGRKATDFLRKRDYNLHASFTQIGVDTAFAEVQAIADAITGIYLDGTVDEVHIAYTEFVTAIQQRAKVIKFLPIESPSAGDGEPARQLEYIFEPDAPGLMAHLLPRYVETQIYHLLLESVASEYGARMTAMSNATENAGEMIDNLTLTYNKARQATITRELLEVVGGAEALKTG